MKMHSDHSINKYTTLLTGVTLAAGLLSAQTGRAQVNSLITGFTPVFPIGNIVGPGGESVSLNTQISWGFFAGLGNEYLYQYQVHVNAGSPAVDGFNLWTIGPLAGNAAGAINLAVAANANDKIATFADVGGAGPGGPLQIPPTPGGTPAASPFVAAVSTPLPGAFYNFPGGVGQLFQNINLNTTVADPNAPVGAVAGLNWDFTYWTDGAGDSLMRFFSDGGPGGGNSMLAGDTMTFDVFSPFGPVAAGAFPDPQGPSAVDTSFDDVNGDITAPVADTDVPEPSTWSLLALSVLGFGVVGRIRRPVRA